MQAFLNQLFIVASFFLSFQDKERKMEKRLERIPFVIDIFPLSFFILTISLGNFPSVLLHYFVRRSRMSYNKKKKKGALEFFSRPLNSQTSFQVYYFWIIISRGKDLDTNPRICNYRTLSCPLRRNVTLEK